MKTVELTITLGLIGEKADKLQSLFNGFSIEENEEGFFLKFTNFDYIGNKGVSVHTNCFESEEHFNEILLTKLLFTI